MVRGFFKRHKIMILASIFFFYTGCIISVSVLRLDCADASFSYEEKKIVDAKENNIEYVVLILTGPDNESKRDAIRATWMKFQSNIIIENGERIYKWNHTWTFQSIPQNIIKFYFVVGIQSLAGSKVVKLQTENERTNDLLILNDVEDSYKNLAIKMLHAIKWVDINLKGLKYAIKCDDDSFLRIDLIIKELEAFAPEMNGSEISTFVSYKKHVSPCRGLYWGYFDGRARVYLNGKWQEQSWFLCDNYLPYALGGGYVISQSIVNFIAKNADSLSHYNSEDVSMGVWTSALADINRVHDVRFDTEWKSRGCSNEMLVRHKQTPSDMFQMYRTLVYSQGEKLCKAERSDRKSYSYKWNVLPSTCCR